MDIRIRFYLAGMAAAILLFIIGELVWLPDPIPFPGSARWIDLVDGLFYTLAAAPLLWAAASLRGLTEALRTRRFWPGLRSGLVLVPAAGAVCAIAVFRAEQPLLIAAAGLFGAAWIAVFIDMAFIMRSRGRRQTPVFALLGATMLILAALFWPLPYMVTYPGITLNMNRYAQAEGGSIKGRIDGVLIFERPAFPADWLYAKLFPHYRFEPIGKLGMPLAQYDELVKAMKQDANGAGSAIAYQHMGLGKGIVSQGVRITGIQKDSPAEGALHAGDLIIAVNGHPVLTVIELTDRMGEASPGKPVRVTIKRAGVVSAVNAGTRAYPGDAKRAVFGITVENMLKPDLPGTVRFHRYLVHEGGPSHGAMLALALIDQLTPGGVTGGLRVAGTGTIGVGGVIGPVGGVEQKAYTVYRTGADVFFVPAGLEQEARRGAPQLRIVPVKTLDDVLKWLREQR
jgi:PDZ domain-containing protein